MLLVMPCQDCKRISFGVNDYIKIDNEFFKLTAVTPDTTGITILQISDEKTIGASDGQDIKIRYRYSQVRLTAHDFLDVGTGNKTKQTGHSFHINRMFLHRKLTKIVQVVFTTFLLTKMVTLQLVTSSRLNSQLVRQH